MAESEGVVLDGKERFQGGLGANGWKVQLDIEPTWTLLRLALVCFVKRKPLRVTHYFDENPVEQYRRKDADD